MRPPVAVAALLLAAATVAACGGDLGPPRPRPAPTPDTVAPLLEGGARSPRLASYAIDARLDASARRIEATETLTWTNSGTSAVDALPFHLYMNAFKNEDSVFMQESHGHHRNVEFTEHWGWIDVTSVKIAGAELHDQVRWPGPDETVMEVPLAAPVGPGESIAVELTFTTQLPEVFARTGYKGAFLMIGQWFPKIGVRTGPPGAERWACAPFHLDSEFFADFGTYDVRLTVPTTHVVAATGVLTDTTDNPDGTRTLTYRAEDVHDFAWMADPYMQVISGQAKVGDHTVEVRVYHRPAQAAFARRHLAAGIGAIETFSRLLIPYPWPIMTVIDPPVGADGAAGMEYPTLVTTAGDSWWARDGIRLPEYVTIHEIGHNWFQGMLASNEVDEAWLDEGVNDWADGEVIAELYGDRGGLVDWLGIQVELHRAMRAAAAPLASVPSPIATASWAFVDADAYGDATYRKTELALKTLENLVGRDTFLAAMKGYATTWAFRHPTGRDFFAAVEQGVGRDLAWFWGPVFYGTGSVDWSVREVACLPRHDARGVFGTGDARRVVAATPDTGTYACAVTIVNHGTISVPVDVELRFADGTSLRQTWTPRGEGKWTRFELERSSPVVEVAVDPEGRVLLSDNLLDDHVRLHDDSAAAWRAAARLTFWTHSAMQVVGL